MNGFEHYEKGEWLLEHCSVNTIKNEPESAIAAAVAAQAHFAAADSMLSALLIILSHSDDREGLRKAEKEMSKWASRLGGTSELDY